MKLVTFSKPMAPHGVGDTRLVGDDLARQLERDGVISAAEPWPAPAPKKPQRPILHPTRPVVTPQRPGAAELDLQIAE